MAGSAGSGTLAEGQQSDHLVMAAAVASWEAARAKGGLPQRRRCGKQSFAVQRLEFV